MKLKREFARYLLPLLLLTCGSGCVTRALWKNENLEAHNEPANNPNLRLFETKRQNDFLVVYDEYSERHAATHTRAYWLNENQKLAEQQRKPHFVSANSASHLVAVPVFVSSTNETVLRAGVYALAETNQLSFTLYSDGTEINSYTLPSYNDGMGKVEKVFLTPPAATADATIAASVLGLFYIAAKSGATPTFDPSCWFGY